MGTLFLVSPERRDEMDANGELTEDDMIEHSEFAIVLSHELLHWAIDILKQQHTEMVQWELLRNARAKLN